MVYLTHYTEYPIYEAAEGGYYYAGNEVDDYERLSLRQAKRRFAEIVEELLETNEYEEHPWIKVAPRRIVKGSRYIGDGESYIIERKLGSEKRGYTPYC